jgi:hypothetical protein
MVYPSLPLGRSQVATSRPAAESIAGRPAPLGLAARLKGWLARFAEARDRRAAILVLRHLDQRLPHASEPDRAYLVALADDLRRRLR